MNKKSGFKIICFLLFCYVSIVFCLKNYNEKYLYNVFENIQKCDDLNMTIYYLPPHILTDIPINKQQLINHKDTIIINVESDKVKNALENIDQIQQYNVESKNKSKYVDARIHYVIEGKTEGVILKVTMWGSNNYGIVVNDIEFKHNKLFYDIILPFVPEEIDDYLNNLIS